jgi:hypothetical protein
MKNKRRSIDESPEDSLQAFRDIKCAILGYLIVLGDKAVLARLDPSEREIGGRSVIGSLVYVNDYLERIKEDSQDVLPLATQRAIMARETINASPQKKYSEMFSVLTKAAAECVLCLYKELQKTAHRYELSCSSIDVEMMDSQEDLKKEWEDGGMPF